MPHLTKKPHYSGQFFRPNWLMGLVVVGTTILNVTLPPSSFADEIAEEQVKQVAATDPAQPEHPLTPALKLAYASRESLSAVKDYEASFAKKEFMGRQLKSQTATLKIRREPFSVYMKFIQPNAGREVIFVQGRNNNQLLAHETGFKAIVGTVKLDINGPDAMEDNRYPITNLGLHKLLDMIIAQWEQESKFGECDVKYYPNAKLGKDLACQVIESSHPQPRKEFKFSMTRLYIEKQSNLPVRVEQFGFMNPGDKEPPRMEEYTYTNLKVNPGLTDKDFDPKNPAYAFP